MTLGQSQEMTLTFNTHTTFINSISCLHLPTFRSQAALLSEKSTVFTFSYRKPQVTKFYLVIKKVKVNQGPSFEQTMLGWSHKGYIRSFVEISPPIPEKKNFEGFLPYMGVAAILVANKLSFPLSKGGST